MSPDEHTNGFSFGYVYLVHRMPFEREINNEFNEIQCVYFLPLLSWLSYSTAGSSLCICHKCKKEVYNLELPLTYK